MPGEEFAWECECGHIEYSNVIPSDCSKCLAISSFTQLPEELMNEREKDKLDEEDLGLSAAPSKSAKLPKAKSPKLKKPGKRRKRK